MHDFLFYMTLNKETMMLVSHVLAKIIKSFTDRGQTDPIIAVMLPKFNCSN